MKPASNDTGIREMGIKQDQDARGSSATTDPVPTGTEDIVRLAEELLEIKKRNGNNTAEREFWIRAAKQMMCQVVEVDSSVAAQTTKLDALALRQAFEGVAVFGETGCGKSKGVKDAEESVMSCDGDEIDTSCCEGEKA